MDGEAVVVGYEGGFELWFREERRVS